MSGIVVRRLADSVALSRRGDALTISKLPSFIDSTNRTLLSADAASVVVRSMIRSVAPGAHDEFKPTPVQRECWAWLLDSSPPDMVAIAPTGSGKTLAYLLPIVIEILSSSPSRSCDPVSVTVPLTPEAEQSARAEALSAMKAMATSVFAREISAGKTPEQAHQIASEEGKVVWQRTLREAKQRLATASSIGAEPSVASSSTSKAEPRALVLVPTRELCQQISDAANEIVKFVAESSSEMANHIRVSCVFGGVDFHRQRTAILAKLPSIMIATPGRLLGLCGIVPASTRARMAGQQKGPRGGPQAPLELPSEKLEPAVSLSATRVLVLDEADRLLELGFEDDLKAVLELLPNATRPWTMLFSATWNDQTATLARQLLAATAVHITIGHAALAASITVEQRVEVMTGKQRKGAPRLRRLLQLLDDFLGSSGRGLTDDDIDVAVQETADLDTEQAVGEIDLEEPSAETQSVAEAECNRVIVFVLFKQEAKTLSRLLISKGVDAVALHGDLSQTQRSAAINDFRSGEARVLVATDVAARGLDVKGVELVINYSLGLSLDMYVHRCGRCGRAGQSGIAHSFVVDGDESMAPALVALMARTRQHVSEELRELATEWASKLAAAEKKSKKAAQARDQSDSDDDADFDRRERMANVQKQREMQQKKMQREHAQQKSRPHGNRRK